MTFDLAGFRPEDVSQLDDSSLKDALSKVLKLMEEDRKESQILYYQPVSPIAKEAHACTARTMALFGGNGACIPLDAPVLMANGSWKPLGEIVIGDMVIGADPETGLAKPSRVTNTFRSGKKPVYRISFSDGGSFRATAEHMVPLYLGSGRKTSKGKPKHPKKRRLGDYIEPIIRRGDANPSKRISAVSPSDITFTTGAGELQIEPYALGALIGDGSIVKGMPRFHNDSVRVVERVRDQLRLNQISTVDYGGGDWGLPNVENEGNKPGDRAPNRLRLILTSLGLWGQNSYTKFIPDAVFDLSRHCRLKFLAGLIDTDGYEHGYSTCSARLAQDFAKLVRSLGGKATITPDVARCQTGAVVDYFRIYWRLNERLALCLSHKQPENQRGKPIDYRRRVCRTAELEGVAECGDIEVDHPSHCYVTGDYVIVSNSKTDTCLAELAALSTGIFPDSIGADIRGKFRGPIAVRIVIESLTTTLHPIILPKLQWWKWSGVSEQGGPKGHWGWIPRSALKKGEWDKSWSEKLRILTVICRDPDNGDILGESTWQFMSHDQDPTDFASGDFHHVLHDEPPSFAIWRENQARTMRVGGRMLLSMTWPDEPAIPVDWIYDEVYDKGGPGGDKNVRYFEMSSLDNNNLNQETVRQQMASWDDQTRAARIHGRPIRFSNLIHPYFTDHDQYWCHVCGRETIPTEGYACPSCGSHDLVEYNHVKEFATARNWPVVWVLDPHPRKPHMFLWAMVDPSDDIWVVQDGELDGDPVNLVRYVHDMETQMGLDVKLRLMDPNMGRSPAGAKRNITWQDEFDAVGLNCELADDGDVGRGRINEYLKPDQYRYQPRIHFHPRCHRTIFQMRRFAWSDWKRQEEKDMKQKPRDKYSDYPAMLRYLMNYDPKFDWLRGGAPIIHRAGKRVGAY